MKRGRWSLNPICVVLALTLLPAAAAAAAIERISIVGSDDWPADTVISLGSLSCAGGDIVWIGPLPTCPGSGQLHWRDAVAYSCVSVVTASGSPEPRLTGVAGFTFNANFDADYAGPVWGRFLIVPAEACNADLLGDPEVFWEGVWRGKRVQLCAGESCQWVGSLKYDGRGHGGAIEGLHVKFKETVLTLTPVPLPYELIPGLCAPGPCPPEAQISGRIFGR